MVGQNEDTEGLGFQNTIMYGRYSRQLGEFAKLEALKQAEKKRLKEEKARKNELRKHHGKFSKTIGFIWRHTFAKLGEDWIFLAVLGIIMALVSFATDKGITICNKARIWLYSEVASDPFLKYISWISLPVCLILFSAGFVHLVAPQSIGSGIPEMKTILRGVVLKEYLTFRTLVAKIVGLTATLGSGLPLGKEGPFVHIASIVATLLGKLVTGFQGIYENESRNTEMLAAACAVGVGACFAAPVGGVLFSIEVTTVYFAVRNYWRGFFAAVCGAAVFRLLSVWFDDAATVTAIFRTNFHMDYPFDPQELFVFALIGVFSGLGGALYIWMHRRYVIFMRKSKIINTFLKGNFFLYPGFVALLVTTISYPPGLGQFSAANLSTHDQVTSLFSNFTWTGYNRTVEQQNIIRHWETPYTNIFINLSIYSLITFFTSIISSTVPVPSGIFIPVFKIGAGLGRMVGEAMHMWFPTGMYYGGRLAQIVPGGYAIVGAAAFSGAVTHTISVTVIVFEMTGQITHLVPIMIAVLIANAIASLLGPSIYDSIILIKKLPYLPDFLPSSSGMYNVYVEDFMFRDVKYIYNNMTYEQLKILLKENKKLKSFPLVDKPDSMILLGSVPRFQLIELIEKHIGRDRRLQVAAIRQKEAEDKALEEAIKMAEDRQRRPSRFHVSPAVDALNIRQRSENQMNTDQAIFNPVFGTQPKKSILKKTNSFNLKGFNPLTSYSQNSTPYTTVTGAESRLRLAFDNIFRKSTQLLDADNRDSEPILNDVKTPVIIPTSPTSIKKVQLPNERICDMTPEDQITWEEDQMQLPVDFGKCQVDPAPFQLVEKTSLLKVHFLFSMIGINIAYVTATGKLVGVVGLRELRKAMEDANSGALKPHIVEINTFYNRNITSIPMNDLSKGNDKEKETDLRTALISDKDSEC